MPCLKKKKKEKVDSRTHTKIQCKIETDSQTVRCVNKKKKNSQKTFFNFFKNCGCYCHLPT